MWHGILGEQFRRPLAVRVSNSNPLTGRMDGWQALPRGTGIRSMHVGNSRGCRILRFSEGCGFRSNTCRNSRRNRDPRQSLNPNRLAKIIPAPAPLHRQHSAKARFPLRNAVISLGSFSQWVRLDNRFNFSLRHKIKRFVQIFRPVLLAADDA